MKSVFALVGPTASGKSQLVGELARDLDLHVINADTSQLYRHMTIGTAKPSQADRERCPHHLFDILDPDQDTTAFAWAEQAEAVIGATHTQKGVPLLVGGNGFYLRALETPPLEISEEARSRSHQLNQDGIERAYREIIAHDPQLKADLKPTDIYRISRAYALLKEGHRPSELFKDQSKARGKRYAIAYYGIMYPRAELHHRIKQRSLEMFKEGLVEETKTILQHFPLARHRLLRTIGYREAISLLEGCLKESDAIEQVIIRTRQYAKRQITWFKNQVDTHWMTPENAHNIIAKALRERYET